MEFSILMPVYKAADTLEESVQSVLRQAFEDYELLLVEDGSPDESGQICDALTARHPDRIRVLHCPHRGTIPTRREAIAAARGDFILWLDADDLMEPDTLPYLHQLRADHGDPDMILYEFTAFYEDDRPDDKRPPLFADLTVFEGEAAKKSLYELYIRGNQLDALWAKATRRELFQNDPTDYTPYLSNPYGEDALHGLYPLTHAARVLYTDRRLTRYRIRQNSLMHRFDKARLDQRLNTGKFAFFEPFMKEWGLWDEEHRTLLKASSYRGVLDGILYFMLEDGYDQGEVREYARGFVWEHPELKELARSRCLSAKNRLIFRLFASGRFGPLCTAIKARRKLH
ncbi:MAG: glycosyltransferase family 2 protein [Lachnospiraceae bacterium]|nr:glycosyltransferase family 2 protein [Lachnospiraceae bacterium]